MTRFEDENESLMMQLKKMATRSRSTIKISYNPKDKNPLNSNNSTLYSLLTKLEYVDLSGHSIIEY